MRYVALISFMDPSDGEWVEAGRTFVSGEADVYRQFPERFEMARSSSFDGDITRPGGTARLVGKRQRAPKRLAKKTPASSRPSWQLTQREPWRLC